jgi:predicted AAA+ superfamily ATPase
MMPTAPRLSRDAEAVLRDLNPWWRSGIGVRPPAPAYRRPAIRELSRRLFRPKGLIEVVRGPRQVGKTTGMHQIIEDLIGAGVEPTNILFVRFDLQLLREEEQGLRRIARWFEDEIRRRPFAEGAPAYLFLDEIHKLRRWHEEVKHLGDTHPLRILMTGSSSVLVARGGRESLAGRIFTTELPPFSFREVLECWKPALAGALPPAVPIERAIESDLVEFNADMARLRPQQRLSMGRALERFYVRGGYPRLHSGEVDDDRWADYLVQTVFENVLGADIPDLFPVESPGLLRHLYLAVARNTCRELSQNELAAVANQAGFATNQPTVRKYLHYLSDALLIREFRRFPVAKAASSRFPAKLSVTDLGVRNAIFRGAPSLSESDPMLLGPLVETLVQACLRGPNVSVHFFRDYAEPGNRRSPLREVDFVVERLDGAILPVEVKFRRSVSAGDLDGIRTLRSRFDAPRVLVVTRDRSEWSARDGVLYMPLIHFLLAV